MNGIEREPSTHSSFREQPILNEIVDVIHPDFQVHTMSGAASRNVQQVIEKNRSPPQVAQEDQSQVVFSFELSKKLLSDSSLFPVSVPGSPTLATFDNSANILNENLNKKRFQRVATVFSNGNRVFMALLVLAERAATS